MSGSIDPEVWRRAVAGAEHVGAYGQRIADVLAQSFQDGRVQASYDWIADQAGITSELTGVRRVVARLKRRG